MTDIELIKKYKKGEIESFGLIYNKYIEDIYYNIYFRTFSENLSKNILEKSFLDLLNSLENIVIEEESDLKEIIISISEDYITKYLEEIKNNNPELNIDSEFKRLVHT